ncbi:aldo/keto reductase [uncultured Ellagibacter sp.]|uniref:aldo/keto reductase n=1 Tax=uncultured Ellagibacter sp. TaxID=2137580 RepID=UPI00262FC85E|nr:aldo/keto reductase [uncultured Ellagibacter sp.]
MNNTMNRRSFLKGSLAFGAAAALGLAGCASEQTAGDSSAAADSTPSASDAANNSASTSASNALTPSAYSPSFDLSARTVMLNNGVAMPALGIGTYILSSAQAEESVYAALMAGTRLVDTARIYGNEEGVGRGIVRAGVPRDEVFLTTKLWTADFANAAAAIDGSLQRLGQDYVDLMLLHHEDASDEDAYRAMEDAVAAGKIRCIGISNFYESGFARMLDMASIPPAVLQNETQPYFQERSVKEAIAGAGTILESWFPLCGKADCRTLFADPIVAEVAGNHGISPAQAVIRWHLQSGNVCIPGSSNPDHIREDADVFGFSLTADEMAAIDALDRNQRYASY